MSNYPASAKNATFIGNVVEYSYSLDDQCRMEFGEGFGFCKSFQANAYSKLVDFPGMSLNSFLQLDDPCRDLWCSHSSTPDKCKTKKGPPMNGTECGEGKWCVDGACASMDTKRSNIDGLRSVKPAGAAGAKTATKTIKIIAATAKKFLTGTGN